MDTVVRSGGDVDTASADFVSLRLARQKVGRDHIIDEGKITALHPITKDGWSLAIAHLANKPRNHGRILGCRVLTRAEDVEIPQ